MPLNTSALKSALEAAFMTNLSAPTPTQVSQINALATSMTAALQAFVESATITYTTGLTAPGGAVIGVLGNVIT